MPDLSASAVWIVEDDPDYRETVAECVGGAVGAVEAFGSVAEAVARLDSFRAGAAPDGGWPSAVLLDVNLPGMSGIDGVAEIKRRLPATSVVMLTIRDDPETLYAALGAGASGYLLKTATADEIRAALDEAHGGGVLVRGRVAELVLGAFEAHRPAPDYGLTPREADVLREMAAGRTQPQIAERLFVTASTVNSHVQSVYAKLHVNNANAAVAKAVRERIVPV